MDASKALAELRRVLKPGGLLAAAVWQSPEACSFWCDFTVQLAHGTFLLLCGEMQRTLVMLHFGAAAAAAAFWVTWELLPAHAFVCSLTSLPLPADIDPGTVAQASEEEEVPYSATRFGDPAALLAALAAAGLGQVECREVMVAYSMSADDWWPSLLHIPGVPIKASRGWKGWLGVWSGWMGGW